MTMAHTDQRDDLSLRFPILQKKRITKYSKKYKLEPAYTMAVIRRESAFANEARSTVGAIGLMQIMPATGKSIAKRLKVKFNDKKQLLNPDTNIQFGTKYLNMMLNKFYQQPALASAAYNAGGHRVKAWLPKEKAMKADRWVETIPFNETREYVSSILAYTAIYQYQLQQSPMRLSSVMPNVPKKSKKKK
jgi:soluble lytic murein transglycosylase